MINTIYLIRNKINDKVYVGQTWQSLKQRWANGKGYILCTYLNNAILSYGKDKFYYEIITFCGTQETADLLEDYFINKYNSRNPEYGFNIKTGGSRGVPNEQTKLKMSESNKGDKNYFFGKSFAGPKHPQWGIPKSDETKRKISEANTGKRFSPERKKEISDRIKGSGNPMYGKKHTESMKQKVRGNNHHSAKLKESDVKIIKQMLRDNIPLCEIARKFKITSGNVISIKKGKTWSHVS